MNKLLKRADIRISLALVLLSNASRVCHPKWGGLHQ